MTLFRRLPIYSRPQIEEVMKKKGYNFFSGDTSYNLNLIGIRNKDHESGFFNDSLYVIYKGADRQWSCHQFDMTTDAGLYYRHNPINPKGTAWLLPGQYRGAFKIGKHQGRYKALVQASPMLFLRDFNRDDYPDWESMPTEEAMIGCNMHRAYRDKTAKIVGKFSAACQVLASPEDFDRVVNLCEIAARIYGSKFTYTLLDESDFTENKPAIVTVEDFNAEMQTILAETMICTEMAQKISGRGGFGALAGKKAENNLISAQILLRNILNLPFEDVITELPKAALNQDKPVIAGLAHKAIVDLILKVDNILLQIDEQTLAKNYLCIINAWLIESSVEFDLISKATRPG